MSQKKYSLLYPDTNAQYRTLSDVTMHDLVKATVLPQKTDALEYFHKIITHFFLLKDILENIAAVLCHAGSAYKRAITFWM